MHFVFLCGGFFPNYSATGNCVREIVMLLKKRLACNISVICKNFGETDIEEKIDGVRIFRVVNERLRKDYLLSQKANRIFGFALFFHKMCWALRRLFSKNGLDNTLVKKYLETLNKLDSIDKIDAVLPCCMPAEALYSSLLFKHNNNVLLYPLLYDLYSENKDFFRFKCNHRFRKKAAFKIECQLFLVSRKIFYTDNWSFYFRLNHFSNSIRVEHPLVVQRRMTPNTRILPSNMINIVYQGEIDYKTRPPRALIDSFKPMFFICPNLKIHIFAYGNATKDIASFSSSFPHNVCFYGKVNKDIADNYFDCCDIAVILANKNPNIVPSKIFECVASGKPIIYYFFSKEEKAYSLLEKYPLVFFCQQGLFNFRDEKNKLLEWIRENYKKRVPFDEVIKLYEDATPDYVINEIIKDVER